MPKGKHTKAALAPEDRKRGVKEAEQSGFIDRVLLDNSRVLYLREVQATLRELQKLPIQENELVIDRIAYLKREVAFFEREHRYWPTQGQEKHLRKIGATIAAYRRTGIEPCFRYTKTQRDSYREHLSIIRSEKQRRKHHWLEVAGLYNLPLKPPYRKTMDE